MPNDILLYENIDMFSATEFINAINLLEQSELDELVIRINTNGGEPAYMWGMVAKFREFTGKKLVKIDGKAYSGGLFFLCYCDDSEALDIAQGLVHRAAYPEWFEADPDYFTDELKGALAQINKSLETAFRAKINVEAFEALKQVKDKGLTVKKIFSMDSRDDVFLSAKDMKKIGLVNRIVTITPAIQIELDSYNAKILVKYTAAKPEPIGKPVKKEVMTLQEFKAAHPGVYAEAVSEGILQERDRVEGIMVFNEIAPEVCKEAVASGKPLSEKHRNEIFLKNMAAAALVKVGAESPKPTPTTEQPVNPGDMTEAQKKEAAKKAVEAEVMSQFPEVK
jgi:ATP-dependent protease ClpP protease subunit